MELGSTSLMSRERDIKASYECHVGQNPDRDHGFGEMWGKKMFSVLSEMCLLCRGRCWWEMCGLERSTVWSSLWRKTPNMHTDRDMKISPRTKDKANKYQEKRWHIRLVGTTKPHVAVTVNCTICVKPSTRSLVQPKRSNTEVNVDRDIIHKSQKAEKKLHVISWQADYGIGTGWWSVITQAKPKKYCVQWKKPGTKHTQTVILWVWNFQTHT